MKRVVLVLLNVLFLTTLYANSQTNGNKRPVDYVDPLIGTSNARWMLFPGPSMPFGMVKLSPDNRERGWKAGYEYLVDNITGFSHIHSWTMAGLSTMPTVGELQIVPGTEKKPQNGYRSKFNHDNEIAKVGYYSVLLDDYNVKAELTSTTRAGFHRYTFPKTDSARVLFDLVFDTEYSFEFYNAQVDKVSDTELAGYSIQQSLRGANYNEYTVHFFIRFNKPFRSFNYWIKDEITKDVSKFYAGWGHKDCGFWVEYDTEKNEPIMVQVGISLVSIEQARLNLDEELTNKFAWDFDAVVEESQNTWNDILSKIKIETNNEEDKIKFYTNMYRAYVGRTIWSDVNGKYIDMWEKEQQMPNPDEPIYGGDAFWNTFWNLNQLWNLVTPDVSKKWVKSLLEIYDKGGWLPKGPTGIEYSGIMVASHSIPLMVAAYQSGITDFDTEKAFEAMYHQQMVPGRAHDAGGYAGNRALDAYMDLGYIPNERGPVSNTLEFAYDDWCVAQFAKALGKKKEFKYFMKRSQNYENVFDPSVKYVRMRYEDGSWVEPFDSLCCSTFLGAGYVEGNAWQYTWFVPHNVKYIVDFLGKETFNHRLNKGFEQSAPWKFNSEGVDFSESLHSVGVLPVNHGNQPNMQAAYLFNYAGKPWLTQKWVREIMYEFYGAGPIDGWPGDEDQGQMGAWFVMSSIGLFQMNGGASVTPIWEIGSPIFDRVTIQLDNNYYSGKQFVIETKNNSKDNRYIQSAKLNGKELSKPWLYHTDVVGGGKLELIMGDKPNKKWGSADKDAPPSFMN